MTSAARPPAGRRPERGRIRCMSDSFNTKRYSIAGCRSVSYRSFCRSAGELGENLFDFSHTLCDLVQVGADLESILSGELVMLIALDQLHHAHCIDRRVG